MRIELVGATPEGTSGDAEESGARKIETGGGVQMDQVVWPKLSMFFLRGQSFGA